MKSFVIAHLYKVRIQFKMNICPLMLGANKTVYTFNKVYLTNKYFLYLYSIKEVKIKSPFVTGIVSQSLLSREY